MYSLDTHSFSYVNCLAYNLRISKGQTITGVNLFIMKAIVNGSISSVSLFLIPRNQEIFVYVAVDFVMGNIEFI